MNFYKSNKTTVGEAILVPHTSNVSKGNVEKMDEAQEEQLLLLPVLSLNYFIKCLFDWNDIETYKTAQQASQDLLAYFDRDDTRRDAWKISLQSALDVLHPEFAHIKKYIEGDGAKMANSQLAKDIFEIDLKNLKPLHIVLEQKGDHDTTQDFEALLTEIRGEIRKGTKVSFKMLQELQGQIETALDHPVDSEEIPVAPVISQQQVVDLTKELEVITRRSNQSIDLIIKGVDTLDLIRKAAEQANLDQLWIDQINQATNTYIKELESLDVEEIQVLGEILDGERMISIGTVPVDSTDGYKKFEVCIVHERGFINKRTSDVIREAKVVNAY